MSTSAGGILIFLLLAVVLPGATLGLAYLRSGQGRASRPQGEDHADSPPPLPSWVRFSLASFAAAVTSILGGVVLLVVLVWAVALHLLDKGYAVAEVLLFVALISGGAAYGWLQGVGRADPGRAD